MSEGFWDRLGLDEGMLPEHLPMGVNADCQGPENDTQAHHFDCWCADPKCPLTKALEEAWEAGRRSADRKPSVGTGALIQYMVPAVYAGSQQGDMPVPMVRADDLKRAQEN